MQKQLVINDYNNKILQKDKENTEKLSDLEKTVQEKIEIIKTLKAEIKAQNDSFVNLENEVRDSLFSDILQTINYIFKKIQIYFKMAAAFSNANDFEYIFIFHVSHITYLLIGPSELVST